MPAPPSRWPSLPLPVPRGRDGPAAARVAAAPSPLRLRSSAPPDQGSDRGRRAWFRAGPSRFCRRCLPKRSCVCGPDGSAPESRRRTEGDRSGPHLAMGAGTTETPIGAQSSRTCVRGLSATLPTISGGDQWRCETRLHTEPGTSAHLPRPTCARPTRLVEKFPGRIPGRTCRGWVVCL